MNDDLIPGVKPLKTCIDDALARPNHAKAMAEFCTPSMILGNAVENNHHLGMAFAQLGLEGIECQRKIAEDAAQSHAQAEEEAMKIEFPDDSPNSSHFVSLKKNLTSSS